MRRALAVIAVLTLTSPLALVMSGQAAAHTDVLSTSPVDGERLDQAPTQVTITTREPLQEMGSAIVVTGPSGARVDDGSTEIDGNVTLVGLTALSEFGSYVVDYRLLASDGHLIEGQFRFELVEGATTESPSPEPTQTPTTEPSAEPEPTAGAGFPWWIVAVVLALTSAGALAYRSRR